jgi:hypothetical protein
VRRTNTAVPVRRERPRPLLGNAVTTQARLAPVIGLIKLYVRILYDSLLSAPGCSSVPGRHGGRGPSMRVLVP